LIKEFRAAAKVIVILNMYWLFRHQSQDL